MREWKIICDKCGVEITGNPFVVTLEHVGREEDAPVIGETYKLDLCEKCADKLRSWKAVHASAGVVPERKTPDPGEKEIFEELSEGEEDIPEEKQIEELPPLEVPKTTRKKTKSDTVDIGKMVALRNAGWTYKQIAEEMKLTDKQVSNYLYNAKKRGLQ